MLKNRPNKKLYTVHLDQEVVERFKEIALEEDVSRDFLIRKAMKRFLHNRKKKDKTTDVN